MKRMVWLPIALLATAAPQAFVHARTALAAVKTAQDFPAVRALADAAVQSGRVPGIVIAVGVGNKPTAFISAGAVTLGTEHMTNPDTLWRIYSMTKPITGIAAMILVDDGKLKLDQPVADFIPEFKNSNVLLAPDKGLEARPASRPITIRDLLTHTSGLNYALGGNTPALAELKRAGVVPMQVNRQSEAEVRPLRPATLQEFARRAGKSALVADPGTKFSYSMGLDVLAAVVEKAAGMPFETFVQRRLLMPLRMRSTSWQVPGADVARFATNYVDRAVAPMLGQTSASGADKWLPIDPANNSPYLDAPSFPYGGAGLVSTAHDYDRFLHMLQNNGVLDGVRVLRSETARLAKSNLLPEGVELKNFGPVLPNEPTGFGAGGFVTTLAVDGLGRRRGTYGWDGAAGTRGWVDTDRQVRVTTMINVFGAPGLTNEIDKAVSADLAAERR